MMSIELYTFLLIVGVSTLAVSRASVELNGCQSDPVCAGTTIDYNCSADSSDIQIVLLSTDNTALLDVSFNDSSPIGDANSKTISPSVTAWYNKTSDTSVRVWFNAHSSLDGYSFECRDVENNTDVEVDDCDITINDALASPSSFGLADDNYCMTTNFTWTTTGSTTCLKDFVVKVNSDDVVVGSGVRSYTGINEASANDTKQCVSIASRSYSRTSDFSDPQCVKFDVPIQPQSLMKAITSNNDDDELVDIMITWMRPDASRPNVIAYYLTSNITATDSDDDVTSSGSSGDNEGGNTMMNAFRTVMIPGNKIMMMFEGAKEGSRYQVKITAENCYGNSTEGSLSFIATKDDSMSTTPTPVTSDTPEPSSSPTLDDDDDEGLATFVYIIIGVVGGLLLLALVIGLVVCILCCCVCGGIACCAAASSDKPYDMEMGRTGTKL